MRIDIPTPRAAIPEQPRSNTNSSSIATNTPAAAMQDAIPSTSSDPATSSGLSTGVLVGIVIVAAFLALGLGILAAYLLRRWIRKRGTRKNNHYVGMPPAQYPGFQLQRGYTQSGRSQSTKSNTSKRYPVTTHIIVPQELPALEPAAVELPAASYWHLYR
ncbi:hypothetical protein F4821DRAFT_235810 [Hypoxylon rubiginosum]|uniref:Uncharacterized protein n=1 Tax=Hypoxylon rubiginosum TaxID=110542 RepID=A0ACC0D4T8_9PEZI|nr:hypothetical protein F4821DRAFT_235810 [Hypoxylon rubiginosum]